MDHTLQIEKASYTLDRNEALRYMGYRGQEYDEALAQRIEEGFRHCEQVSQPGWAYRIFPVQVRDQTIELVGSALALEGSSIYTHLSGASYCAVMAATCGLANERELARLNAKNSFEALVFDAAGSALVEAAGNACNAAIVAQAKAENLYTNYRYGPGYGNLSLEVQPSIIKVLDATKTLGISTTASNMLVPTKSITAFVGLFTTPQDSKASCTDCSFMPYCTLRKAGQTCYQ